MLLLQFLPVKQVVQVEQDKLFKPVLELQIEEVVVAVAVGQVYHWQEQVVQV
jgi:hypothetical protein